ncbi:hypothetical protein ASG83_07470 [Yonghaparkia sp. Soil809]|nr:hypothetical protein ASG83_07470 [Yonghaparkia sp. Soil809]
MRAGRRHGEAETDTMQPRWTPARLVTAAYLAGVALAAIIVVVALAAIVWALPRGFDVTDEGWLYTLLTNDRVTAGEAWGFHHLLHPLFEALGSSVLAFRWLRLGVYVLLGLALTATAHRAAALVGWRLPPSAWALIAVASQLGTLMAFTYPPRYVSYNELAAWLAQPCAAALLLVIAGAAGGATARRPAALLWVGVGLLTALLVAAKFSASIALLVLVVVALIVAQRPLAALARICFTAVGALTAAALLAVSGFPFAAYANNVVGLLTDREAQDAYAHPASELLVEYAQAIRDDVVAMGIPLLAGALLLLVLRVGGRTSDRAGRPTALTVFALVAPIALAAALILRPAARPFDAIGGTLVVLGVAATASLAVAIAGTTRPSSADGSSAARARWHGAAAIAVVALAPFAAAAGTNNDLTGQLLYGASLWAVALALGLVVLAERTGSRLPAARLVAPLVVGVMLVQGGLHVRGDIVEHPYRIAPYAQQTEPATTAPLDGLLLEPEAAAWADWLEESGETLDAEGVPTIAISSPAALLLFNASDYASPWVAVNWGVSFLSIERSCANGAPDRLLVLEPEHLAADPARATETRERFIDAIAACGLDYPADFEVVDARESDDPRWAITVREYRADR